MNYCPHCMSEIGDNAKKCSHCGENVAIHNRPHQLPALSILHGRYMIGKVLGEGGFGITYIGRDLVEDRPVAVKEYYPSGLASRVSSTTLSVSVATAKDEYQRGRDSFINEAIRMQKFVDEDNIVKVLGVFYENGTAYIVMEYIDGMTLSRYMDNNGPFRSFDELYAELRPALVSLSHVHEAGMIHRDISPSNLMIDREGNIKLIDFGTARDMSEDGEKSLSVVLKHGFAPPEQYTKHGRQGAWTDVYAMCATIYKLLTGETPLSSTDRAFTSVAMRSPSEFGVRINKTQERVLQDGMALRIEERIPDMKELMRRFDGAKKTASSPKPKPSPVPEPGPKPPPLLKPLFRLGSGQKKLLLIVAAAVVVLAVVIAVFAGKASEKTEVAVPVKTESSQPSAESGKATEGSKLLPRSLPKVRTGKTGGDNKNQYEGS